MLLDDSFLMYMTALNTPPPPPPRRTLPGSPHDTPPSPPKEDHRSSNSAAATNSFWIGCPYYQFSPQMDPLLVSFSPRSFILGVSRLPMSTLEVCYSLFFSLPFPLFCLSSCEPTPTHLLRCRVFPRNIRTPPRPLSW